MTIPTIPNSQIAYRKKIGKLGSAQVYEIGLMGGLHLIAKTDSDGKALILGTAPHRAIARHIALKRNPDIVWTELSKSDWVDPQFFEELLPKYEKLTDDMNKANEE